VVGIAVPFALAGVRTNPMVGVSKAMGFFAIFYVLMSIASIFGERQIIPAMLAAWIPNLALLAVSAHLFEKDL
jgi:lipopolysaccharide export system permease protein